MLKFVVGFIVGFIVATIGVGGITKMADQGVNTAKTTLQQQSTEAGAVVRDAAKQ